MTVSDALADIATRCGGDSARADAEILLAHALGLPRSQLFSRLRTPMPEAPMSSLYALAARRAAGEPVAYLTGAQGFWTLDLAVTPAVLVPRPETEQLVEWALESLPRTPTRVLDLGTGSGAIALALARERPQAQVWAVDISPQALEVARANASRLGLNNVQFQCADFVTALAASAAFDLIVSNPPYIAAGDPHLSALTHEPALALVSGADGLDALRRIIAAAPAALHAGGMLLLEHGHDQGAAVRALLAAAGFDAITTRRDLNGRERHSGGTRP